MIKTSSLPYLDQLRYVGQKADSNLDPARVLLLVASRDHPGISVSRFDSHLEKLGTKTATQFETLIKSAKDKDKNNPDTKRRALKTVLWQDGGYRQDDIPARLENLDLMRVIDRRRGLSQTLSVLYLHAARAAGWTAHILALPSHFVLRIDDGPQRLIFDPADRCRVLEAVDLRQLVKSILGEEAELSADYYNPLSNREIVIRIQNYRKLRQIEQEDYSEALRTVMDLQLIAPDEYRLLLDQGVLLARTEDPEGAVAALQRYIERTPDYREKQDALLLIQHIYDSLET